MTTPNNINRVDSLSPIKTAAELVVESVNAADATIRKEGDRSSGITIPRSMSYGAAARALQRQADAEVELVDFQYCVETMHGYEAAIAVKRVLAEFYGIDYASPTPGMFGDVAPDEYRVPVAPGKFDTAIIGQFVTGDFTVRTRLTDKDGLCRLLITCSIANRDKHKAELFAQRVSEQTPCWTGQIITYDNNSNVFEIPKLVAPQFTTDNIALNPDESAGLQLFLDQISHHERLADLGIPFKRGVLLYGPYGTGKTLAAACAMSACVAAGITVMQVRDWSRVLHMVRQARDYGPTMVFIEDIDLMPSRALTNLLDDATLKTCPISIVVTTNFPEKLDPALTRKGRLDICIGFTLPEPETRAHILAINDVRFFNSDISDATEGMSGADLAELSKRARITALAAQRDMTASDVLGAATTMVKPPEYVAPDSLLDALRSVFTAALGDTQEHITSNYDRIVEIHDRVC